MEKGRHNDDMCEKIAKGVLSPSRQYVVAGILLVAGIGLSVALFIVFRDRQRERIATDFREIANDRVSIVKREIDIPVLILKALQLFYDGSHEVERSEFRTFVTPLLQRSSGIKALEWIPRVTASQRESYERAARRGGLAGFRISDRKRGGGLVPSPQRKEYFPAYFVEPLEGNEKAVGFDLGSDPVRMAILRRSGDTGRMMATGRIVLVQAKHRQFGFLIFAPVYREGTPRDTVADRRRNLEGFVLGVFITRDIVENALTYHGAQGIDMCVIDRSRPAGQQSLYCHSSARQHSHAAAEGYGPVDSRNLEYRATLDVAAMQWTVVCRPTAEFISARTNSQPQLVLAVALLLTCILTLYMAGAARHAGRMIATNRRLASEVARRQKAEYALAASNRDLRRTAETLGEVNRELTDFVYIASHDLREPLRKVSCFGELLHESLADRLEPDDRENLQYMIDGANRMAQMIDGLLAYSRLNTSDESSEPIDLNEMIEQLKRLELAVAIEESGATIDVAAALPRVHADRVQLRQVLQNLIANGIKYHREGQPPRIEIVASADDDKSVRIEVRDNGIGIPEQYRRNVFKMFKRLHSRQKFEGTGIGLAICKKILNRHGGRIGAEANEPVGTIFWFTLPAVCEEAVRAEPAAVA